METLNDIFNWLNNSRNQCQTLHEYLLGKLPKSAHLKEFPNSINSTVIIQFDDRDFEMSIITIGEQYEVLLKKNNKPYFDDNLGYYDVKRFSTKEEILDEINRICQ